MTAVRQIVIPYGWIDAVAILALLLICFPPSVRALFGFGLLRGVLLALLPHPGFLCHGPALPAEPLKAPMRVNLT